MRTKLVCFKGIRSTVVTNSYAGEKEDLLEHSQTQGRGLESGTARGGNAQLPGQDRAAKRWYQNPVVGETQKSNYHHFA